GKRHQDTDPPHPFGLLRARRERPGDRRAAQYGDEIATLHCGVPPVFATEGSHTHTAGDCCAAGFQSRLGPLGVERARAARRAAAAHVRFAPIATELMRRREVSPSVKSGFEQSQHGRPYSITSSARVMSVGGTSRPSAVAVLRLMTSSYLVG